MKCIVLRENHTYDFLEVERLPYTEAVLTGETVVGLDQLKPAKEEKIEFVEIAIGPEFVVLRAPTNG